MKYVVLEEEAGVSKEVNATWGMVQDGEHMYTCGGFVLMFGKTNTVFQV